MDLMTTDNLTPNIPGLPTGLVVMRSSDRIMDVGLRNGCAITHNVAVTEFYASDFWCGPLQDPMTRCAHFGPYPTLLQARQQLEDDEITYFDSDGVDGSSTWLVLP